MKITLNESTQTVEELWNHFEKRIKPLTYFASCVLSEFRINTV